MQLPVKEGKAITVLLVEGFSIARIGLRETLNSYGNVRIVGEAENAIQAMSLAEKFKPDIVLMDVILQDISIRNLLIEIKKKLKNTRVIILTAHKSTNDVISILSAGANAYCSKNITPETLSFVIDNVAKGVCWVDPAASETALSMFKQSHSYENFDVHLTDREKEVLKHIVKGESNAQIAKELIVSVHTAKAHVCNVMQKLGVDDRVKAAVLAVKANLV